MKKTLIDNAWIVSPGYEEKCGAVLICGGRIESVIRNGEPRPSADEVKDAAGSLVVPGFIDIHTHGAMGEEVTGDNPSAVEIVAGAKLSEGCTLFAPTTLTLPEDILKRTAERVASYASSAKYANVIGLHLEGPYINPECLGAQNPDFVRPPDINEVKRISEVVRVTEVSFAVEKDPDSEFTRMCLEAGIVPSCGHSKAHYSDFSRAYHTGLRHLTHFCNQMTPLHHRDIGLVGAGLLHDDVVLELICDRVHLCDDMIRLVFARHPLSKICVITDSMMASHLPDGPSSLGGLDVIVKDGQARLTSNGALAGSVLRMNKALKNIRDVTGLPLQDIVRTTSLNQAVELGLDGELGRVAPGFDADLAMLDPESFDVLGVFVKGEDRSDRLM